ncbi:MAG: cation:proton antiporter [Shewanella sp.]|uniref:cation:proton antiporter n=1 Tax=Shewanella sp. SNU WT4 TaxID=2590015 RepID=UPI00112C1878|nr:sodium:proton antiporter [Shewanella sp. SNU WT4]QDF67263.1 sodium:proton antiporter [Shewanella sp. SNU WT4]
MSVYHILCYFGAAAVLMAYLNSKLGKFQPTIAITAGAIMLSLLLVFTGRFHIFEFKAVAAHVINELDFQHFLLEGILGFLLFAGAINIKLTNLKDQKWEITVLALFATLVSTFFIGFVFYGFCQLIGLPLALVYCLLFGALISPTDPIAVLAIVKKLQAPERISTQIEGESLFNDGFGLVIFVTLFTIAFGDITPTVSSVSLLFLQEALGGILYGLVLGTLVHKLICHTADPSLEQLLTLLIPSAGYALASSLGVSGPLAMVVTGIIIGNWTRSQGFSPKTSDNLNHFWELIEEFLNCLLFLLIGLLMLTFAFHREDWLLMAFAIPLVLVGRYLSVRLSYLGFNRFRRYNPMAVSILTWGGLRGGLAIAMAMSVPAGIMVLPEKNIDVREIMLVMTYAVVVFSILVQGSTITPMITKAKRLDAESHQATSSDNAGGRVQ